MINVTKSFLPKQEEYKEILKEAWDNVWITNRGSLVKKLETKLKTYLNVPSILATTNGTLPLQIAIKALGLTGEIITTPFSYVATTSSIVWEGCTPVFVDIDPNFLTIDESKIEAAITNTTTAILATHVFGNPCAVDSIAAIAAKHKLKVIYDAAHAFGVTYKGDSIFNYGDVSTCSFHATKLFHTGEGGALFAKNPELMSTLFYHHNFGHKGKEAFQGLGINAKMSEPQAAMGLSVFKYIDAIITDRERVVNMYRVHLKGVQFLTIREDTRWNNSYFPIIFKTEVELLQAMQKLELKEIFARRYFYPSLDTLPYIENSRHCPISADISSRILCLPLFYDLKDKDVTLIIDTLNNS